MAFTKYTFKEEDARTYKGIKYYKFNDEYIINLPNGIHAKRFSIKDVKSRINDYLNKGE